MSLDELCRERLGLSEAEAERNVARLRYMYQIEQFTLEALRWEAHGDENETLYCRNRVTEYRQELAEL